jgi:membrane-bound ClpP family serine protease
MEEKSLSSTFGFWKKISVFLLALFILGFLLAVYLHVLFVDVLFLEGMLFFVFGAFAAAGMGNPRTVNIKTTTADPEFYREYLEDQRPKQLSEGIILMIIGAVLMILAVVIGLSTMAH